MRTHVYGFTLVALALSQAGCGTKRNDHREGADQTGVPVFKPDEAYVLRGQWTMAVGTPGQGGAGSLQTLLASAETQPIAATVAANVQFDVANDGFVTPVPVDIASYGTLDVTTLRDNDLRICGAGGNDRCTSAVLRIYTTGTPGAGLWSTVEGYGLPILSGAGTVGLDPAGALVLGTVAITTSQRQVRLRDFTTEVEYAVPVSVDFSDAAKGSYASTLVLEYLLQ